MHDTMILTSKAEMRISQLMVAICNSTNIVEMFTVPEQHRFYPNCVNIIREFYKKRKKS